jgi:hypothetical protein
VRQVAAVEARVALELAQHALMLHRPIWVVVLVLQDIRQPEAQLERPRGAAQLVEHLAVVGVRRDFAPGDGHEDHARQRQRLRRGEAALGNARDCEWRLGLRMELQP